MAEVEGGATMWGKSGLVFLVRYSKVESGFELTRQGHSLRTACCHFGKGGLVWTWCTMLRRGTLHMPTSQRPDSEEGETGTNASEVM